MHCYPFLWYKLDKSCFLFQYPNTLQLVTRVSNLIVRIRCNCFMCHVEQFLHVSLGSPTTNYKAFFNLHKAVGFELWEVVNLRAHLIVNDNSPCGNHTEIFVIAFQFAKEKDTVPFGWNYLHFYVYEGKFPLSYEDNQAINFVVSSS